MAEALAAEPRPKAHPKGPFIMPDGRPLAAFLDSQQLRSPHGGSGQRRRPGAVREPKEGWTKPLPRAAAAMERGEPASEAEVAELHALSRVGHRKQRRWLNDKLLRDMAGSLSAADMASLFKPVPFGEPRASLWERAAQPEHAVLWDLFRSLDMDKQTRVLQKWEAHVRELQAGPAAIQNPAIDALAAWAGVSWKARQAMKRARTAHVEGIEAQITSWLQQEESGGPQELVVEGLEDGFHRLIAHGLAGGWRLQQAATGCRSAAAHLHCRSEYHSLSSHSRPLEGGGKAVVVRRRAAAAPPPDAPATSPAGRRPEGDEAGGEAGAAAAVGGPRTLAIACSDILHILVDERDQPLSAAVLHQAYLLPLDSSSEAGERCPEGLHDDQAHGPPAPQQQQQQQPQEQHR